MQKNILFSGISTLIIALVGYYLAYIYECGYSVSCYDLTFHTALPLMYGGGALAIVFALLYAFPQTFSAWRKFAIWFIPLAALLFIFYPDPGSGDFLSPMPEQLFQWVSALFIVISALIIGITNRKI